MSPQEIQNATAMEEALQILKAHKKKKSALEKHQRIQRARLVYCKRHGISFLPISLFDSQRCWVEECRYELLLGQYYICPRHLCLHRCDKKTCKLNYERRCVFIGEAQENEMQDMMSVDRTNSEETTMNRKTSRTDARGERSSKAFENGMRDVINAICSKSKRIYYNTLDQNEQLIVPWGSVMTEKLLLERDIRKLAMILFDNCKKKKELRLLQTHSHAFSFYIMQKLVLGIQHDHVPVLNLTHVKWLSPLPSRAKFTKYFGIHLKKYASCLKICQYLLSLNSVRNTIRNKFQ